MKETKPDKIILLRYGEVNKNLKVLASIFCLNIGKVYERFYGPHEHFLGWGYTLCEEIIDQVILENRQESPGRQNIERRKEFRNKVSMKIEKND